ncbi:uncharacterized protein TRUGW13939_00120 [Talaromyces rugulosus]|uniref:Cupin type-2 domain-containing protein n=1 Tax=Talaromyces rugulosus TaxID=121627 RepID=A0A7H8QGM4_TALRU|nr:uncharacterized protein TRUGW13939_00120 [Talaromyces rugulosus]QKX53049.1 hypothetical protein TRUGW13939_00120 [Talaromyces rugulosus]
MVTARAMITHADDAPAYWQIGNLWRTMATGVQTDNVFTLLDQIVHSGGGGGPCTHTHTQDEGLYVVSGKCTFNAGGNDGLPAGPGTFVAIPRLTEHSFTVDEEDTQLLNFYLPAGFEVLLTGIAHPADRNEPPPPGVPLPPPHLVRKLASDYGQTAVLGMPFIDKARPGIMSTRPTPGATIFPFTAHAKGVPSYWYKDGLWSVLGSSKQTGESYTMLQLNLRKGVISSPHIYNDHDEVFYILSGDCTFLLGDRIERCSKGALVFIPKGTPSSHRVDSETALMLNIHTPGGFDEALEQLGQKATEFRLPNIGDSAEVKQTDARLRNMLLNGLGIKNIAVTDPLS